MAIKENEQMAKELMGLLPLLHKYIFQNSAKDAELAVPNKQMQALTVLFFFGRLNMTQLTANLGASKQQMTQIVDGLVQKELVFRAVGAENRRLVLIELTPVGRRLVEELVSQKTEEIRVLFAVLSDGERDTVMTAAQLVKQALVVKIQQRRQEQGGGALAQPLCDEGEWPDY